MGGRLPALPRARRRRDDRRRRRQRVRRLLPRATQARWRAIRPRRRCGRSAEIEGITTMLPTEDAAWVGAELARRFGIPYWQFSLTATDANRWMIRMCRQVTGRDRIAVFSWCYHGSVDESFVRLDEQGLARAREGLVGPPVDPTETTRVAEFNEAESVRVGAGARRRGVPADGAGAHEHRDRAAGAGLHGRGARPLRRARHAPDHRRDAHAQRRALEAARPPGSSGRMSSRSASRSAAASRSAPTE